MMNDTILMLIGGVIGTAIGIGLGHVVVVLWR